MLILRINFVKDVQRAAKSVRYHAFRSRELPEHQRGLFDRSSDHADVARFIRSLHDPLTKDRTTQRGRVIQPAKMHRLMFSLRRWDFERCGLTSWKPVIREAMDGFERYHGIRLEWVAAEHQASAHPHVHIDIKSVASAADGTRHRLMITQEMRMHFRWAVEGIMQRERTRAEEERRQERELNRAVHDLSRTIMRGLRDAARDEYHESSPRLPRRPKRRLLLREQEQERDDRGR